MKGIPMKTWEVRALLDNRKTVTRRVVKPQPERREVPGETGCYLYRGISCGLDGMTSFAPYRKGDILYVRETWRIWRAHRYDADAHIEFKAGGEGIVLCFPNGNTDSTNRADYDSFTKKWGVGGKWHPSIHMPNKVARIFLRVTDIRVERLWDMLPCDIQREGCPYIYSGFDEEQAPDWYGWMKNVWDSAIKPADRAIYGWEANPYVWVIKFDRISREEAQIGGRK